MHALNLERLIAYQALLARSDEASVRGRGHHVTQAGLQRRWIETWLPACRVWTERQIAAQIGATDGWTSGVREQSPRVVKMR